MQRFVLAACSVLLLASVCSAHLQLPAVFGSNMVLQRAPQQARVWGWASPNEAVTVSIAGQTSSTKGDANSQWSVLLAPVEASGPYVLSVTGAAFTISFENVMFGDVFICSGQSNMQMTVNMAFNATAEIQDAANYPNIRLFTVQETIAYSPQLDLVPEAPYVWGVNSPTTINGSVWDYFSATCYFFGREISRAYPTLPIGLIGTDWGGTIVQAWSSPDALAKCNGSLEAMGRDIPFDEYTGVGDNPNQPSVLWNGQIYPLLNMTVRGAVWYQGESNSNDPNGYACMFPAMISDWRAKFGQPLPFFFVQLAAFFGGGYADIRWAQTEALQLDDVGMAVAIDLGDPGSPWSSIHPRNKQEVGRRLSLAALDIVYGQDVEWQGPTPVSSSMQQVGELWLITIDYDHVPSANFSYVPSEGCDTCCSPSSPDPFEINTSDGKWVPASSTPQGDQVMLRVALSEGQSPVAFRYAWVDYPECVLVDPDTGLAAPPFKAQL